MSVILAQISPTRVQPFMRMDNSDPVGQMLGDASLTGDASGGTNILSFTLPENNVYLIRWVKIQAVSAIDLAFDVSLSTGLILGSSTVSWRKTGFIVSDGTTAIDTFEPRRLLVFGDRNPSINGTIPNVLNQDLDMQWSAVFWTRQAFIDMPSEKFSRFL